MCTVCGKEKHVKPSRLERTKFCSRACAKIGWTGVRRAPGTEFKKGNIPPSYRGGRYTDKNGYEYIRVKGHPMANPNGYVPEHRLVWAQAHGVEVVPKGMVIHHLNGIPKDNRPENLQAIPREQHGMFHHIHEVQERLRLVEAELAALKEETGRT